MVADTNFIANSRASIEALKSANLLKNLNLSAIIIGEEGVGKTTLAKTIIQANIIDSQKLDDVLSAIAQKQPIILKNFHKITNFDIVKNCLATNPTRIIATANSTITPDIVDDFFSLKIALPPLRDRLEDVKILQDKFLKEANSIFLTSKERSIDLENMELDLTKNTHSLRHSIYKAVVIDSFTEDDILNILENVLSERIGGGNDYRDQLYLFDVPLLRAGFKKFHSQLSISDKFGLNRNTLRKKINELEDFFKKNNL